MKSETLNMLGFTKLGIRLSSTYDAKEEIIHLYNDISSVWWTKGSVVSMMHKSCDTIYPYIKSKITRKKDSIEQPLQGLKVLDVGCGGGIVTERLARDGALTTGIDINAKLIDVAKGHASLDSTISNRLSYFVQPVEEHANQNAGKYDVIISKYVLLYITDQEGFLNDCIKCLKPNGSFIVCTINKTWVSWFYYVLLRQKMLPNFPKKLVYWNLCTTPEDDCRIVRHNGCKVQEVRGLYHNLMWNKYYWTEHKYLDYVVHITKI